MRIIKEGKTPEPKTYWITCYHCGTVFEVKGTEFRYNYREGYYTECPVCKYFNDKPSAEVLDNENEDEDKNNKSWEEYQKIVISTNDNIPPFPEYKEVECKCPKCGADHIYKNISEVLTSFPPQYYYKCKKCGWNSIGH